jgi:hypothetical protein
MFNCNIRTIPASQHRYETTGDWWYENGGAIQIRVSDLDNWKEEFLVAFHELIEAVLCKAHDIPEGSVTIFDITNNKLCEPGDSPDAPYHREHTFAMAIEKLIELEMNRGGD